MTRDSMPSGDLLKLMDSMAVFAEMLGGMEATITAKGYTPDQARAMIAAVFGWRNPNGTRPEGSPG